jgi:hypothetical protein
MKQMLMMTEQTPVTAAAELQTGYLGGCATGVGAHQPLKGRLSGSATWFICCFCIWPGPGS